MSKIKAFLKRIGWIHDINARYKSQLVKKTHSDTVRYYARKHSPNLPKSLLAKCKGEALLKLNALHRPLNIFWLGTDELQDWGGILQALSRLGELTYFTRANGSYGLNYPGLEPERRRTNSERLIELFADLAAKGQTPNLLITQTWAGYVNPKVLGGIRERHGTFIVNIAMDDRHQYWGCKVKDEWWGTYGLIPCLDLTLTAAPECVEWYEKEGCPALYFPEASDPEIFHPMPELPKIHDVCFVGSRYGIRDRIVTALRKAGVLVATYGHGWENDRLGIKEVPRLFAQSKIILGVGTIGHCEDFFALKMRDFDGPMSGSLYLTHDNPDLYPLFKVGEEVVTYRTVEDCVQKVKWYLAHEEERERIAAAGRDRAVKDHTWDKRFGDLFTLLRVGSEYL